jgi:hypothetical protein
MELKISHEAYYRSAQVIALRDPACGGRHIYKRKSSIHEKTFQKSKAPYKPPGLYRGCDQRVRFVGATGHDEIGRGAVKSL